MFIGFEKYASAATGVSASKSDLLIVSVLDWPLAIPAGIVNSIKKLP
jgi:hypothetical protein